MKPLAIKVRMLPRWVQWLGVGLAGAGLLVAFAGGGQGEEAPAAPERDGAARGAPPRSSAGRAAAAPGRVELERLNLAQAAVDAVGNVFGATSWYVPPPPPPPAPPGPPPLPTAPPLPFAYLGSYAGAAAPVLILAKGDRVYTVAPGDVIDGTYRVDGLSGGFVELTYLPLNVKQTLGTGGA